MRRATATARASSSRSTAPRGCTGTCASSTTGRSRRGRCPTACRRRRRTTAWRCARRTTRSSTSSSTGRSRRATTAPGRCGSGTRGRYDVLKWDDRKVEVELHGEQVRGRYALFKIAKEPGGDEWMIHRMDPPPQEGWGAGQEPMPEALTPMLARLGDLPADERGWAFEIKWDGVRALAFSTPGHIRFVTPHGQRHERPLSRAAPAQPGAGHARGDPRRRGRGLRRGGPPELRAPAVAHPPDGRVARAPRGEGAPGHVHRVRPAVARRPLADGRALRGPPREAVRAPGAGGALAGARARRRQRRGAAGGQPRTGARGHRRQAPRTRRTSPGGAAAPG